MHLRAESSRKLHKLSRHVAHVTYAQFRFRNRICFPLCCARLCCAVFLHLQFHTLCTCTLNYNNSHSYFASKSNKICLDSQLRRKGRVGWVGCVACYGCKGFSSHSSLINMHTERTALLSVIPFFVYMYVCCFCGKGENICWKVQTCLDWKQKLCQQINVSPLAHLGLARCFPGRKTKI